jgi:glutathione S-transferase
MAAMTIYGNSGSGNCLKVRWIAAHLGIPFTWMEVDVPAGGTRTPAMLALNPAGRVPFVILPDGEKLSESNAIMIHLAEGSALIPGEALPRARMLQWLFWEQYSHEPYIAVRRYHLHYFDRDPATLDPKLEERGKDALRLMEGRLGDSPYLAGDTLSLADVALIAYTRMAHEGGFDLAPFPRIRDWIGRVEDALGIGPYRP